MKNRLKQYIILSIVLLAPLSLFAQQCVNNTSTILFDADNSSNRYMMTPADNPSDPLLSFISVSDISGGTYGNTSTNPSATYNGIRSKTGVTYFVMSGITGSVQSNKYYFFNITTSSNAPILNFMKFSAIAIDVDTALSPGGMSNVSYNLRVAVLDPDTNTVVNLGDIFVNSASPVFSSVNYNLKPGKVYQIRLYPWNTNGQTNVYLDNPRLFLDPIPVSANPNVCASSLSGTIGSSLAPYVTSSTPSGSSLRWLQGATDVTNNTIAAGTYTPYYYKSTSNCYNPAGNSVVVNGGPTSVTVNPASQTVTRNGTPTSITVSASGATSYQWYSNASNSNTGGTAISGATSASYTPPTNAIGAFYYYVIVGNGTCSTTSPAVQVNVQNCNAGNNPPVISSFTN